MQNNAIKFNVYEKQIMQDTDFLKAKREIILKTENIFAQLQEEISKEFTYMQWLENALDLNFQGPKISKGENYKGLPYVVLDHPRYLAGTHIFTFRSLFWWGNFYSFSLFLQGEPLEKLKHFFDTIDMAKDENLFVGIGNTLWEYDFSPENYMPVKSLSKDQIQELFEKDFLKISYKFPLSISENEVVEKGLECFRKIKGMLNF